MARRGCAHLMGLRRRRYTPGHTFRAKFRTVWRKDRMRRKIGQKTGFEVIFERNLVGPAENAIQD